MNQLPHDIAAEKAILGSILLNSNCLDSLSDINLAPSDFYLDSHQKIYEIICWLAEQNKAIDLVFISAALKDRGWFDQVGGINTLTEIFDQSGFHLSNITHYGKLVRDRGIQRSIIQTCSEIINRGLSGVEEIDEFVNFAESKVFQVTRAKQKQNIRSLAEIASGNIAKLQDLFVSGGKSVVGIETGFKKFDQLTSGLHPGQVMVLAARPGMGKTSWFISALLHIGVVQKKTAALFSLEMSSDDLGIRFWSALTRIDLKRMKTGLLSKEEFRRVMNASEQMGSSKIYIDDSGSVSVMDIRSTCRRLAASVGGLDLIIIDYLQLMQGQKLGNNANREQEISSISRGLKQLAKELSVPIIALSQLNRLSQNRTDKRPILSDLRESGAIEQDADLVCFIHREDYYDKDTEDKGVAELIVAKNRHGEADTVKLGWLGQYTLFTNLDEGNSNEMGSILPGL